MFSYTATLPFLPSYLPSYVRPFAENNLALFSGMTGLYLGMIRDLQQAQAQALQGPRAARRWPVAQFDMDERWRAAAQQRWAEVDVTVTLDMEEAADPEAP